MAAYSPRRLAEYLTLVARYAASASPSLPSPPEPLLTLTHHPSVLFAGNGWAAAGITRVLATILYSNYAADYTNETTNLANWAEDIVTAAFAEIRSDDLLPNIFGVSSGSTFSDGGASALLASVAYRLASLGYISSNGSLIETAEQIRAAVEDSIGSDGWLSPVSDPLTFTDEGSESPEAQAFVLLLEAAFADWMA